MKNKLISILCEGPHDVAFLTKVFKTLDFKNNEKLKLGQYPQPIADLMISEATKTNVQDLNIQEYRNTLIPSSTLEKDNIFLFLYSIGSASKRNIRVDYLKKIMNLIPKEGEISRYPVADFGIIYFFDADEVGINSRIDDINSEIDEVFKIRPFIDNGEVKLVEGLRLGSYIFSKEKTDLGKLEDIIMPLMRMGNEKIFDNAELYLKEHVDEARCKVKYDHQKSTIGLCGQLQKSGSSNVVCIGQTDYLTNEKILNDVTCKSILEFVNRFIE